MIGTAERLERRLRYDGRSSAEARHFVRRDMELEPGFRVRMFHEVRLAPEWLKKLDQSSRLLGLPEKGR